jgi:hypothetical protein
MFVFFTIVVLLCGFAVAKLWDAKKFVFAAFVAGAILLLAIFMQVTASYLISHHIGYGYYNRY